jgi:4-aminobutyrate aminotransferase
MDTVTETGKNVMEKMTRISIKTELPGPEARKIIEMDSKYLVTSTKSLPVVGKRGSGLFVEDVDGNVFLDFASGISVTNMGHVHPYITEKVAQQLYKMWHFAGTDYYYREQVDAAKLLTEITPGKFDKKVFFSNSGAEANEASLKLAKIHRGKQQFIAFIGGFHGRTQGALAFTASKSTQHKGLFPWMAGVTHVPFPNPYRNPFGIDGYESPDELTNRVLDFIDTYIFKMQFPPEDIAAFLVEPIQGEGGYIVPPMNFHKKLKKLADEYGILIIMDEVQSGFGRTGKMFASEHFGVEPDIISLAKAIASGIPMGASVVKADLDFPQQGLHSNTFGGNILASVSCIATVEAMQKERAVENAKIQGEYMKKRLLELKDKYPQIGDVRGLGLMLAVDFVKDQRTKEPDAKLRDKVEIASYKNGLLLLSTGVSAMRLIPALNVNKIQIEMGIEALEKSIKQSL